MKVVIKRVGDLDWLGEVYTLEDLESIAASNPEKYRVQDGKLYAELFIPEFETMKVGFTGYLEEVDDELREILGQ